MQAKGGLEKAICSQVQSDVRKLEKAMPMWRKRTCLPKKNPRTPLTQTLAVAKNWRNLAGLPSRERENMSRLKKSRKIIDSKVRLGEDMSTVFLGG